MQVLLGLSWVCCNGGEARSGQGEMMRPRPARVSAPRSSFAGSRFPQDVILIAVRWVPALRAVLPDVEELLAERGIEVDPSLVHTARDDLARPDLDSSSPGQHGAVVLERFVPSWAVEQSVRSAPWAQAAASVGVPSRGRVSLRWPGSASSGRVGTARQYPVPASL